MKRTYKQYLEPDHPSDVPRTSLIRQRQREDDVPDGVLEGNDDGSSEHEDEDHVGNEDNNQSSEDENHDEDLNFVTSSENSMAPGIEDNSESGDDLVSDPSEERSLFDPSELNSPHDTDDSSMQNVTLHTCCNPHNSNYSEGELSDSSDIELHSPHFSQHDSEDSYTSSEDDPFSMLGSDPDPDPDLDTKLACSGQTSKAEAVLMIMSFAARHNLTGTALRDLLLMINAMFGQEVVPQSKYTLNKIFKDSTGEVDLHFYCKSCKGNIGTMQQIVDEKITVCSLCEANIDINEMNGGSFFMNVPIAPQVKVLLENPEINAHLNYRFERTTSGESISDIYDGEGYRKLAAPGGILSDPENLLLQFRWDGIPVFKSSKYSLWPIHLTLNELPPKLRYKHVILAGLWFGASEPAMDVFLRPFVKQAKALAEKGVSWSKNGKQIDSKLVGLVCCVDSVARPQMQNTTQFNGYFGCGFCLHPGVLVDRRIKYPVSAEDYNERTNDSMLEDMEKACHQAERVNGVRGPSPLINLPKFDIVWGFVPEYMHSVLLGVTRQITKLHADSSSSTEPYYVGSPKQIQIIDERLRAIQTPKMITRMPRGLSERAHWKASEWRHWLLFYSLPCLEGLLESKYLNHLSLLVSSIYLLLQEEISPADLDKAEVMLLEFTFRFQILYGEEAMTFNVHLLSHLVRSVHLWGPLWATSAFAFENANGQLLKLIQGTKGIAHQVVNKFLLHRAIPHFASKYPISDATQKFCSNLTDHHVSNASKVNGATVLGSGIPHTPSDAEKVAFQAVAMQIPERVERHKRIVVDGMLLTSQDYKRPQRRNDNYVKLASGGFGEIQRILSFCNEDKNSIFFVMKTFCVQAVFKLPHMFEVIGNSEQVALLPVSAVQAKCLCMKVDRKKFICTFPNAFERD